MRSMFSKIKVSGHGSPEPPKITTTVDVAASAKSRPQRPQKTTTTNVLEASSESPVITSANAVEPSLESPAESPEITFNNAYVSSPESTPLQDTDLFNFISKLPPIEHVKAATVEQDFHWLNSLPLGFTSPRPRLSQRIQYPGSPAGETSHNDDWEKKDADGLDEFEKSLIEFCGGLTSDQDSHKECDTFKGQEYEDSSTQARESQYSIRSRRCLQFGEDPLNSISSVLTNAASEYLVSSPEDLTAVVSKSEMVKFSPGTMMFPSRFGGTPSLPVHKQSSILHLNSLVHVPPTAPRAVANLNVEEDHYKFPASVIRSHEPEITNSCPISSNVEKVPLIDEDEGNNSKASKAVSFATESKKKKNKTSSSTGEKHCNCKKSGCLKLYCDCFVAGLYCGEICTCQGCYNRTEYDHTVLEKRKQIKLRNPLAFGPKIVQHVNEPNSGENGNCATPPSGRHIRGCNCRKSMCCNKYCECNQANVGCSSGCRCKGCQNFFGRRGGGNMP